jgi:hypothetical protein
MFFDENSTLIRVSIQWLLPCGNGVAASVCIDDTVTDTAKPIRQQPSTKLQSENQLAFSLNDHKSWAFEHDFCGVALFLMFAPGFRDTDTALSTIAAVTSTDRSWPRPCQTQNH